MNRRTPSPRLQAIHARLERAVEVAAYNGGLLARVDEHNWRGRHSDKRLVPDALVQSLVKNGTLELTERRGAVVARLLAKPRGTRPEHRASAT